MTRTVFFNILRFFSPLSNGKSIALMIAAMLFACMFNISTASAEAESNTASANETQTEKPKKSLFESDDAKAFYADKEKVEVNADVANILKGIDNRRSRKVMEALNSLSNLTTARGRVYFGKTGTFGKRDSVAEDSLDDVKDNLEKLRKDGDITAAQYQMILNHARNDLYDTGAKRAEEYARQQNKTDVVEKIQAANKSVAEDFDSCPTSDLIRAKYTSGCWSCLVIEKISSAFMTAASKGYALSQKAGLILLGLGSVLWILLWGLRNVSSFTQLESGNILNELIKFSFKVALAYTFITSGLQAVGTYFINPIMGVGAKIAESYWDTDKIKPYTSDYDWELTDEQYKEIYDNTAADNGNQDLAPVKARKVELSEQDKATMELAKQKSAEFNKSTDKIPNFIIPPVFSGHLTDPAGCRYHPKHKKYINHKGLDIGTGGRAGAKIVAAGPGIISYDVQPTGAGNFAKITHKNGWVTAYFHMMADSLSLYPNGTEVQQGQVIGFVGKSGTATGEHLHFEVRKGKNWVDPLRLLGGEIVYIDGVCDAKHVAKFPAGFKHGQNVPRSPSAAWTVSGEPIVDLTSVPTGVNVYENHSSFTDVKIGDIKYTGPTDIMSKAVMDSILGATKAISDITTENMVLGDAIMCYAKLDKGGAWHVFGEKIVITNFWMFLEGVFIWCTGLLLTMAVAFYLLDISFKIGFAVIALPLVVGLWPFELTRDKFGVCIGIIAKSAAIFAFLAITTTFTVQLTDAVYSYEENPDVQTMEDDTDAPRGLAKLYAVYDRASQNAMGAADDSEDTLKKDLQYATDKLELFGTTFVLLLFAFLYSFKLVKATVPDLAEKFFPDKAFGSQQPMHHLATAAAKAVKDTAMKPVKWAGDVAMYQGGKLAKNATKGALGGVGKALSNGVKAATGKGKGNDTTAGGNAARGVGKALSAMGFKNAGQKATDAGNKMDAAFNKVASRNKKDGGEK